MLGHGERGNVFAHIHELGGASGGLLQLQEITLHPLACQEYEIRVSDFFHITRRRFELMGIDTGFNDAFDRDMVAPDLLCQIGCDRGEGGHIEISAHYGKSQAKE